ncbi:DUF1456 family protein [Aliikangiella coralliicola]|uniref:DUF1456 family protein n=1 Tax=Aliikangiella coralliicola TaxID=2592383 RepID=A0A545UFU9_9GAMM|nr:DUF1456 family protein [Aliikangiella coralliicola]TQV88356.1 DUF1456 family protein [Aliikangiella coralliicola]
MTNNDVLRRLRYTFNFNDQKMVALFQLAGLEVTTQIVISWLKKDEDSDFVECNDNQLAHFLNGLIIDRRGQKGENKHVAEERLNNNMILVKLKIALSLKSNDIVDLMKDTHLSITKAELGAFLRKPDHKNFRRCKDQFLRNFLLGIDKKFNVKRPEKYIVNKEAAQKNSHIYKKSAQKFAKSEGKKKVFVNPNVKPPAKKVSESTLSRKKRS